MNRELVGLLFKKVAINRKIELLKVLLKDPKGLPDFNIEHLLKTSENFETAGWETWSSFTLSEQVQDDLKELTELGLVEKKEDKSVLVATGVSGRVYLKRFKIVDEYFDDLRELFAKSEENKQM